MNDFYLECKGAQVTQPEREYIKAIASQIAERFDNPLFVNIGVAWGATMHCLRAGAPRAEMYGVDVDYTKRKIERPELLRSVFLTGDSGLLCKTFNHAIHLLLIDGCHYYGTVKADIEGWAPKTGPDSIVIFHDYAPKPQDLARFRDLSGVKEAVDEWSDGNENWRKVRAVDSLACFVRLR